VIDVIASTVAGPGSSFFIAHVPADKEATERFRSDQRTIYKIHSQQRNAGTPGEFWGRLRIFLGIWLRGWLTRHQKTIQRFASTLVQKRTLSGEELTQALTSAWGGSKPDAAALRNDVTETLLHILNDEGSIQSEETDLLISEENHAGIPARE
jgi:hypothetical protein